MIEIRNLYKSYQGDPVLRGLSCSIQEGESVCLIGPTGCGKSTLLRCLAGLEQPDSGTIEWHSESAPRIGMVFQRFNLFPHLNVLHNLTLAPIQLLGMSRLEAEEVARIHLDAVGLANKGELFPHELSIGQQQRVAIARSLVMKPRILLLDEPLSALDPIAASEVMEVLRKLKKEITLVMITHQLTAASELADRILFLDEGQLCEEGSPEQLLTNPTQPATKRFLSHLKDLHYEIASPHFDRPELNARIEQYCNRFGLGSQAFRFVQLALEEALNLIPLEKGARLLLTKAEQEVRMTLELRFDDMGTPCLEEESCCDELSLSLLQGLCDVLEEHTEGHERILRMELDQERLLLK